MSFPARFPGVCSECETRFFETDLIEGNRENGYQHAVCPDDAHLQPKYTETKFQGTTLEEMGF